jgi:hypothetical protein
MKLPVLTLERWLFVLNIVQTIALIVICFLLKG